MPRSKKHDIEPQGKAFIELASALGCDESEERFNEVLAKVARHKPKRQPKLAKDQKKLSTGSDVK